MSTYALLYTIRLTLVSDGDDRTAFLATVYKKSHIAFKQDEVVASLMDTIGGILAKSKNGGTKILCDNVLFTDTISSDHSARSASWRRYFRCA